MLAELRTIHDELIACIHEMEEHVGLWTLDNTLRNWADSGRASAAMTASMRRRVAVEKAVLYPLLDEIEMHGRLTRRAGAP